MIDTSDIPETGEEFFKTATLVIPRPRELPVKKISVPKIYSWPAKPSLPPVDNWPEPPVYPSTRYRYSSPYLVGEVNVRKPLIEEFGAERAVPFTIWGHVIERYDEILAPLFEQHGRHEVRRRFIESLSFVPTLRETAT